MRFKDENWAFCASQAGGEDGHITCQLAEERGQFLPFPRHFSAFNGENSGGMLEICHLFKKAVLLLT